MGEASTDWREFVTRRQASDEETVRANRRWWDGASDWYQEEHGAFLGDQIWNQQARFRIRLGPLGFDFVENAGTNRPAISYNGTDVLAYVDWNSSIAVDGHVANLWDNFHGYDFDRTNPDARQFFSTTSNDGWQVVEVVTLVDTHTVTVQYAFVARPVGAAEPHQVTLSISHLHRTLYQPTIQGNTLTAEVLPAYFQSVSFGHTPSPIGTLRVAVSGPRAPVGKAISLDDLHGTVDAHGAQYGLANSFTTTYSITNPQVNRLVPLGTETVTFTTAIAAGTPIPALVATPAVAPLP